VRWLGLGFALCGAPLAAQQRVVDDFERPAAWSAVPGEGVSLAIGAGPGRTGAALRLDFDFHGRAGYAVARRAVDLTLPDNYELSFWIRGPAPSNTLEFKLIDSTGTNVWWSVRRNFVPGAEWQRIVIPRRHISFAWGPQGGGDIRRVAAIEIAITAGTGGVGTVWLDELVMVPRDPVRPYAATPTAAADPVAKGSAARHAVDGDTATAWRTAPGAGQTLTVDFGQVRVFGGLILDWGRSAPTGRAIAEVSTDGRAWSVLDSLRVGGGRDFLRLPEAESRFLRLRFGEHRGFELREIFVQPPEWARSPVPMLEAIAAAAPRGCYPRYLLRQQSYWTVVGSADDTSEALMSEDGAVEIMPGGPSLEPFVQAGERFLTWHDAAVSHSLADSELPIPTVRLDWGDLALEVTAAATARGAPAPVAVRYRLIARGARGPSPVLLVALRPFQVNPSWQFLGVPGGPAPIGKVEVSVGEIRVNGERLVSIVTPPARVGAVPFDNGDIVSGGAAPAVPWRIAVDDADSLASAMIVWRPSLGATDTAEFHVLLPLGGGRRIEALGPRRRDPAADMTAFFDDATARWRATLAGFRLQGPGAVDTLARAITASLGYILINRDGAAIQPGSRSYARSWIRDGSLTSTALLRLGRFEEVRAFIEWFLPFQYPSGRAPCCVDRRGADPVPEHDSTGELIYLIAEYVRLSGDTAAARAWWPAAERGAAFLDSLRHERMTPLYRGADSLIFYGLLPPSISHEGYSAKPVHSYWDDFFALRGFKDAAWLARALGHAESAVRWDSVAAEFRRDFFASIALVRARGDLAYLPGSADLADFDATSTTIALDPAGEESRLPRDALQATFARYFREAMARSDTAGGWEAYTPYEWRNVGALVRLGERDRALALLRLLLSDRRPAGWQQWGEVVWRERRIDRFIGDMPHTWVASDFIRSALDLFAYERESDSSIVLLAGVAPEWLEGEGIRLEGLRTADGALTLGARRREDWTEVSYAITGQAPRGGFVLVAPGGRPVEIRLDDRRAAVEPDGTVRIRQPRGRVQLRY
jgi:hypothetical protein